jgi:hypothetical protein
METPLKRYRDEYLEILLRFLWREWTALGVAGQEQVTLRHVVDPEALLLFTCSIGRYDQRLFDEVLDWLTKNGRFLNVQRMRNILRREAFGGGEVLSAVADWLSQRSDPMKWRLLAKMHNQIDEPKVLFHLRDGRSLPRPSDTDSTFLNHGFIRNPVALREHAQIFSSDSTPCLFLRMRALFGLNTRCDVLTYLALNETGHPREVARELCYSQKAIHDVMTDMACSGVVHSSRGARERTFRIASNALPFLIGQVDMPGWINWPILLSMAETIWRMTEELCTAKLAPLVESSEIILTMKPLLERLARAQWGAAIPNSQRQQGRVQLQAFTNAFEAIAGSRWDEERNGDGSQ